MAVEVWRKYECDPWLKLSSILKFQEAEDGQTKL